MAAEEVAPYLEGGTIGIGQAGWVLVVDVVAVMVKLTWCAGVSKTGVGTLQGRREEERHNIGCRTMKVKSRVVRRRQKSLACEGEWNVGVRRGMMRGELGNDYHTLLCCRSGQTRVSQR